MIKKRVEAQAHKSDYESSEFLIRKSYNVRAGSHNISLDNSKCCIMGIINVTPDSFSGDGIDQKPDSAIQTAIEQIEDGADIIDIGGESSRPGAEFVTEAEELKRITPVIKALSKKISVPISIDTYKTNVAKAALDAGASIVNNIKGTQLNKSLLKTIKNYKAAIVLMHMQGTPTNMQNNFSYNNVITDIFEKLKMSIDDCLDAGIEPEQIIIDPGIGFGKSVENNLDIINTLGYFRKLNKPILMGTSRKSFIGKILNNEPHQRLIGSTATVILSALKGAHIVRVHDVKATFEALKMTHAITNQPTLI